MDKQRRERGRPRTNQPGRFYGKETKAPEGALQGRRDRVYAATLQEAQDVAGPLAVNVLDANVVLPVELWARARRTVTGLRAQGVQFGGTPVDVSLLAEEGLKHVLAEIEGHWNDGQPFPELEGVKTPRRPKVKVKPPR